MKIIFLDFDGVLNCYLHRYNDETFSPSTCKNLNILLEKDPDLKIVVSSSWRMWGLDYVRKVLDKNGIDSKKVIDITGNENGNRGHQIQSWMDRNPSTTNFVILDDESDMGNLINRLVKTSSFVGLTSADVDKAIEILKKPV